MSPDAFPDWIIATFDVKAQDPEVLQDAEMLNDPNAPPGEGKETPLSAEAQADLLANTVRLIAPGNVLAATRALGDRLLSGS